MRITVTTNAAAVAAKLRGAKDRIATAHGRTLATFGAKMKTEVQRTYRGAKQTSDIATRTRTGRLRREVAFVVRGTSEGPSLEIGWLKSSADAKTLGYAATHEYGATIRAKSGRYLAIPLDAAKTANGVARGGPRDFTDTFVIRGKSGKLLIMQKVLKDAVPLFVLVDHVTIKARPSLLPSFEKFREPLQQQLAKDAVAAALSKVA